MEEAALRNLIRASLSLAFVAAFSLANTANADMILAFGAGVGGTKTATASGVTTTLGTSSVVPGQTDGFPVTITTIGNVNLIPFPGLSNSVIQAKETFTNVHSVGSATNVGGTISQGFTGVISYTDPTNPATNYLTITFTGLLSGPAGGQTVTLSADNTLLGQSVSFTSTDPRILGINPPGPNLLNDPIRSFNIGLTGLSAPLSISGGTIASFASTNEGGNVSAFVPEPSSVVMAGTAVLVGLGCSRWRRSGTRNV